MQQAFGAAYEARTRYLHLGKVALYRMSYTRKQREYYSTLSGFVNSFFQLEFPQFGMAGKREDIHRRKNWEKGAKK